MKTTLLITSAVKPVAKFTKFQDTEKRITATLDSILMWATIGAKKIVICDGSGYDLTKDINKISEKIKGITIECLTFENNFEKVIELGKGYGEGEIIKWALEKSNILRNENIFAKCTSKLWVKNASIAEKNFRGPFMSDIKGLIYPKMIDTRFYIADIGYYKQWLMNAHEKVNDNKKYYLEHVFLEKILESNVKKWICSPSFRIEGMSGTAEKFQQRTELKSIVRDARNTILKNIY